MWIKITLAGEGPGQERENSLDRLAYIPSDFPYKSKSEFDKDYMNHLFDYAYKLAKAGYPWSKYPPDFDPHRLGSGRR